MTTQLSVWDGVVVRAELVDVLVCVACGHPALAHTETKGCTAQDDLPGRFVCLCYRTASEAREAGHE